MRGGWMIWRAPLRAWEPQQRTLRTRRGEALGNPKATRWRWVSALARVARSVTHNLSRPRHLGIVIPAIIADLDFSAAFDPGRDGLGVPGGFVVRHPGRKLQFSQSL